MKVRTKRELLLITLLCIATSVITSSVNYICYRMDRWDENSKMFSKGYEECYKDVKEMGH